RGTVAERGGGCSVAARQIAPKHQQRGARRKKSLRIAAVRVSSDRRRIVQKDRPGRIQNVRANVDMCEPADLAPELQRVVSRLSGLIVFQLELVLEEVGVNALPPAGGDARERYRAQWVDVRRPEHLRAVVIALKHQLIQGAAADNPIV